MAEDRHRLGWIRRALAILVSAIFAVLGVVGYRQTQDEIQLLLFLAVAGASWFIIGLLFRGIEWVLDSLDNQSK